MKTDRRDKTRKAGFETPGSEDHKETCETRCQTLPLCSFGPVLLKASFMHVCTNDVNCNVVARRAVIPPVQSTSQQVLHQL